MHKFTYLTKFVLVGVFLCIIGNYAQVVPEFDWSIKASGTARDAGLAVIVDPSGNVYLTGEFFSTTLAFPGKTLTMPGGSGNCDFFLVKFNPQGNAIWGINGGGSLTDRGYGVALDHLGNVVTTGHYFGQAVFGPHTLNSSGNLDCFTAKLDTAGNYLWMKEGKSVSQVSTRSMAVDANGNIVIVGYYGSSSVDSVNFDGLKIVTNGQRDCFIAKYNNDGNILWGVTGGGSLSGEEAKDVAIDAAGNIYVTGIYNETATFSGVVLNGNGGSEIFIVKYNADGQLAWAKSAGGVKSDEGAGIALDGLGNLYISGRFDSAAVFGSTTFVGNGDYDAYLAKYDTSGNVIWVKYGGGTNKDYLNDISVDVQGNILGIGNFTTQAIFGTDTLTAIGSEDILLIKYNPAGDILWVKQAGGTDIDKGNVMCVDLGGNLIGSGFFNLTAYFGSDTLTSTGLQDVYLTKIGSNPIPVELTSFTAEFSNSKIILKWLTASELNNAGFDIERSSDNRQFNKIGFINGFGTTTENHEYSYFDENISSSKYYYRLKQLDFDGTFAYSNVIEIDASIPSRFELLQNYPNPFNPVTTIEFSLPTDAHVKLSIYNSVGEHVTNVVNSVYTSGNHKVKFDAASLASGIYLYRLTSTKLNGAVLSDTKKLVFMK